MVATEYSVPVTTLRHRILGNVDVDAKIAFYILIYMYLEILHLKGVKKVRSAIKLCSYYFSHYVSNDTSVTGIL